MKSKEEIESYLIQAGLPHEEIGDGMWVTGRPEDSQRIVVKYQSPVLVCRVHVMDLPEQKREELFTELLELNATDLIHGSYGIESDSIVLTEALELSHLDYEEFLAAFESMMVSLASHLRELGSFREAH